MFTVMRCVKDYDEIFRQEVAKFQTLSEAQDFVEIEEKCDSFENVWYEIEIEE